MKKIVVLSGKGGVGKSTITSSIAVLLSKKMKIVCTDCDVDAPNLHLSLGFKKRFEKDIYAMQKAYAVKKFANDDCIAVCPFGAIEKRNGFIAVNELLCEGCGACVNLCQKGLFDMKSVSNATLFVGNTSYGFPLIYAQLKMGNVGSGKIVSTVKDEALKYDADIMLIDSAAGIGCPVIASCKDADLGIVIVEPTEASFSDMKRAIDLLNHFKIEKYVIINKYDMNKDIVNEIESFCNANSIKIISYLPFDKLFVESLVQLKPFVVYSNKYEKKFNDVINEIENFIFSKKEQ